MKITKFGHACLLIEEKDARILIDPGSFSTLQNAVENVDAIFITHEHLDHLSIECLQTILPKSPQAVIYTNPGVGQKLKEAGVSYRLLGDTEKTAIKGVAVEGVGVDHALVYRSLPIVNNTGYMIANRFFYPGDALTLPNRPVEILAYTAIAPWMRIAEGVEYAKAVKPKIAFPVHDGFLKRIASVYYRIPEQEFTKAGIQWVMIEDGGALEV